MTGSTIADMQLLLLLVALGSTRAVDLTIGSHWKGGFNAKACVPITAELHGWKLKVTFDQPITSLDAYTADIAETLDGGKTYVLTNKAWNANEHVGDTLCLEMQGHTTEDMAPTGTAVILGADAAITSSPDHNTPEVVTVGPNETPAVGGSSDNPDVNTNAPAVTAAPVPGTATMTILNDWGDRFQGGFSFPLTEDIKGWLMNVTFSQPVTHMDIDTGDALSKSADGKTWVLVNKPDRPFYKKGTNMDFHFYGNHAGSGKISGTATLTNLGYDPAILTDQPPHNTDCGKYDYCEVLYKSILFYEAQRSGKLPPNNRISWRFDSALGDKGDKGEDLTGGWYDAGDNVKFNFPMAASTTILTWGLLMYPDAYKACGQLDHMYDSIKWPLDYLLKCHTAKDELYVQVGDGAQDHSFWGRPEDMKMARPAFKITDSKPGSDIAMETAAAFAAGYLAFKERDPAYAATLLTHAKELYEFAKAHQGKYSDSVSAASGYYPSNNITDENVWGGVWLYQATGDLKYLEDFKSRFDGEPAWGMSWDDKIAPYQVLYCNLTSDKTERETYKKAVEGTFKAWMPGGTIPYTPKGLAWRLQWASLRYASNMAMVALMAADKCEGVPGEEYRKWARSQIDYALGDAGHSFVVGFGDNYPKKEHHRGASCPIGPAPCGPFFMSGTQDNVHTLYGALVGGPGNHDEYTDERSNYVMNEVACDYNAGFQTAVAALKSLCLRHELPPKA